MTTQTHKSRKSRFVKPLAIGIDVVILIVVTILYSVAAKSSGDQSTALGFISLLLFMFISLPSLTVIFTLTLMKEFRTKALIIYLFASVFAHVLVAYQLGFFDKTIDEIKQKRVQQADPALYSLRHAVSLGPKSNIKKVQDALNAGADPNANLNDQNEFPLIVLAASRADYAVIQVLLEAGANPNAQAGINVNNLDSPRAIDLVLLADTDRDSNLRSLQILRNAGASTEGTSLILGACYQGELLLFSELVSRQPEVSTGRRKNNCLHYAVENTQIEFIRWLLEDQGYQVKAKDMLAQANEYGQLPLDLALSLGKKHIARLMLKHGAQINKERSKTLIDDI
jgi:hypothetical protein